MGKQIRFSVKFSNMARGRAVSFVLMLLMRLVQCDIHPTQFDFIGGEYDLHKLPDHNTSGPFLVQVLYQTNVDGDSQGVASFVILPILLYMYMLLRGY